MTEISDTETGVRSGRREVTDDPASGIGERLAAYRSARGMRVSDLARTVGVSASLISQIERGQSRPSVSTLFAMAEALGLAVDAFFRELPDPEAPLAPDAAAAPGPAAPPGPAASPTAPSAETEYPGKAAGPDAVAERPAPAATAPDVSDDSPYVVRRATRAAIDIANGVRWERLTPTALRNVEFLELVYAPHAESSAMLYQHPGTEMVVVLSGTLDIYVGFERCRLEPGDSMSFPSAVPHRYVNPTGETTRAVTTILHDEVPHAASHEMHPMH